MHHWAAVGFIVLALLPAGGSADDDWTGAASTDFNTAANWSQNRPPNSTDPNVSVSGAGAFRPIISADPPAAMRNLLVGNWAGESLTMTAGNLHVDAIPSAFIAIGRADGTFTARFNMSGGTVTTYRTYLAGQYTGSGTTGYLNLSGTAVYSNLTYTTDWPTFLIGEKGTGTVTIADSALLRSGGVTIGTAGTGTLTLTGGTLQLDGCNNAAGASLGIGGNATAQLNWGGGTIRMNAPTRATNPVDYYGRAYGFGSQINENLTGVGGDAVFDSNGYSVELSGRLSGVGGFRKLGAGTLNLTGASSSYGGGTTISAGTLVVNHNTTSSAGTGAITLGDTNTGASNVQLSINNLNVNNDVTVASQGSGTATISYLPASGNSTLNLGNVTLNRTTILTAPSLAGYVIFMGGTKALSGGGALTIGSTNNQRLILNAPGPAYTGDLTVQNGAIFEPRDQLSSATGNGCTVSSGGVLQIVFTNTAIDALNGGGTVRGNGFDGGTRVLTVGKADGSGRFAGTFQNNGTTLALTKAGAGTQELSGANIAYTGATTVSAGTLRLTDATAFGSPITMNGGTLELNATAGTWLFGKAIAGGTGAGRVVKTGAGTVALTQACTYFATTTINAGTLRIGVANALPANTSLTVAQGTLDLAAASQSVASLALGGGPGDTAAVAVLGNGAALEGALTVTTPGGCAFNGTTTIRVNGAPPPAGATHAVIRYTGAPAGAGAQRVAFANPRATGYVTNNTAAGRVDLVVTATDALRWVGQFTNGWDNSGAANWALASNGLPAGFTNGDEVVFDDGASSYLVQAKAAVTSSRVTVNAAKPYVFEGQPVAVGSDFLALGSGTTTVKNAVSCLRVRVANGILVVGDGGTSGSLVPGGSIQNDGTLAWDRSDSATFASAVNGTGRLVKRGAGTLTLAANNGYSGPTIVQAGALQVNNSGTLWTPNSPNTRYTINTNATLIAGAGGGAVIWQRPVTINGGALQFNTTAAYDALASLTMSGGAVRGSQVRVYDGGGAFTLSGANAFSTPILLLTFSGGTSGGFALDVVAGTTTISAPVTDMAGYAGTRLLKSGAGTLVLSGANTYAGATTVSGGTLLVNGTHSGAGTFAVNAGVLGGVGTVYGAVNVANGATLAPGGAGLAGRFTVQNDVTLGAGATFDVDIQGAAAGQPSDGYDQLVVAAGRTLFVGNGAATLALRAPRGLTLPDAATLILVSGAVSGAPFRNLPEGAETLAGGYRFVIHYGADAVTLTAHQVIPGTLLLVR